MAEKKTPPKAPAKRTPPVKPKGAGRYTNGDKYDWDALKAEYVVDGKPLQQIADENGMNLGTVGRHSSDGKWRLAREKFREDLAKEKIEKTTALLASKYADGQVADYEQIEKAQAELVAQIESGGLMANSLEAATKALTDAIKVKASLAGRPIADKSEVKLTGGIEVNATVRYLEEMDDADLDDLDNSLEATGAGGEDAPQAGAREEES